MPRSRSAQHAHRGDYAAPSQPGVEPAVRKRWVPSPHQGPAPTLGQDGPQHRGVVSSAFARAAKWELVTTIPCRAASPPVPKKRRGMALTPAQQTLVCQSAFRAVVPAGVPRSVRRDGSAPWRGPGASLIRHPGGPRGDRAIAHANQTGPGVQRSEDGGQRSRGQPSGVGPSCPSCTPKAAAGVPISG